MLAFLALTKCKFSKFTSGCQLGLVPGKTRSAIRETDAELFAALKESGSPAAPIYGGQDNFWCPNIRLKSIYSSGKER